MGQIIEKHPVKGITLQNDNGSQFVAHLVREYLRDNNITQEFTHVVTPEENAFIEAYHSILERNVMQRYQFESIYDAGLVMNRWKNYYNNQRLHGSLGNNTPQKIWDNYFEKSGDKMIKNREINTRNRLTKIELLSSF